MAAGIVYHNITTATGVTFALACWVPDTAFPDVGAIPVSLPIKSDGTVIDLSAPSLKVSANFNTPAATHSFVSGEWICDNATAGSVTKLSWAIPRGSGTIRSIRIRKSDQTVATPTIRLFLWDANFTVAVGNDASGNQPMQDCIRFVDVAVVYTGSEDAVGWTNCDIPFSAGTLYGLLQSQSTFTGASGETWTVDLSYLPG
jgi:hypothetical protein